METFILRIDELEDKTLKARFIEEIFDNGENTFDKEIGGTKTRVNALYRIIKSGRIIEALGVATNSKRLTKEFPEAANEAKDLLKRVKNEEFKIDI